MDRHSILQIMYEIQCTASSSLPTRLLAERMDVIYEKASCVLRQTAFQPATSVKGMQLRKGDIIRLEEDGTVAEVAEDNKLVTKMGEPHWGSVSLVGHYPPRFTHKGGITLLNRPD